MATQPNSDEVRLERFQRLELEMIRATTAMEHAALRPLYFLNGGALVVYLALYGSLRTDNGGSVLDLGYTITAMSIWAAGLVAATAATALAAWSQFAFRNLRGQQVKREIANLDNDNEKVGYCKAQADNSGAQGQSRRVKAIWVGILSIVLFIVGFVPAVLSITTNPNL